VLSVVVIGLISSVGAGWTATPSASTPAATAKQRTLVVGTGVCDGSLDIVGVTGKGKWWCDDRMSDPRVSGRETFDLTMTMDRPLRPGMDHPGMDSFVCKNEILKGTGGTWRGTCFGSEFWDKAGKLHTSGHATLFGRGAFKGLVYHLLYAQSPPVDHYVYSGWIEATG
jgi:hypothetical protein